MAWLGWVGLPQVEVLSVLEFLDIFCGMFAVSHHLREDVPPTWLGWERLWDQPLTQNQESLPLQAVYKCHPPCTIQPSTTGLWAHWVPGTILLPMWESWISSSDTILHAFRQIIYQPFVCCCLCWSLFFGLLELSGERNLSWGNALIRLACRHVWGGGIFLINDWCGMI